MNDIATRIAEKIANAVNDAPMGAPVYIAMHNLLFAEHGRKECIQDFIVQLTPSHFY